jgi:hypothetical protein
MIETFSKIPEKIKTEIISDDNIKWELKYGY